MIRTRNAFLCFMFCTLSVMHSAWCNNIPCLNKIETDRDSSIIKYLKGADNSNEFSAANEAQKFVTEHKNDFLEHIAEDVMKHCIKPGETYDYKNMDDIVSAEEVTIPFVWKNQKYDITIKTDLLFDKMDIKFPAGILIANNKTWTPGTEIKPSDMPTIDYLDKKCSARALDGCQDPSKIVTTAGRQIFPEYKGSEQASINILFFVFDNPYKQFHNKVFPGVLLYFTSNDGYARRKFLTIEANNYNKVFKKFEQFANNLQNTSCASSSNYPNHVLYLVDMTTSDTKAEKLPSVRIVSKPIELK